MGRGSRGPDKGAPLSPLLSMRHSAPNDSGGEITFDRCLRRVLCAWNA